MKMVKEDYVMMEDTFKENAKEIIKHKKYIRENATFNNIDIRVGFDVLRVYLPKFVSEQYDKGLNDRHIETAVKRAMKTIEK